jgi:hypothetical protein
MLPVVIEDIITKVTDKTKHVETRQHYAATLRNIIEKSQNALDEYEREKMVKYKK